MNSDHKRALSYLLLGLYVLQQLLPDLTRLYPGVKWLATASAAVAAFWRAYDYWRTAQGIGSLPNVSQEPK